MRNTVLAVTAFSVYVMGLVSLASAQSAYSVRNESMSTGGTTGKSLNFRATTLMAEPVGTGGTSPSFGVEVVIPETIVEVLTFVRPGSWPNLHFSLGDNYPNPFNPVTTITFSIPEKGHVSINIYNVAGQLVNKLVGEIKEPGRHKIAWNGKNKYGHNVASGIYFCRMEVGRFSQTKKLVLLR